ncbi:hypothetical protein PRIPAC_79617 [Pristionchus pacificus]|uniref:G protein-coupled receptor n=1 Tax=Pristionchus pacificus TaxID=54126 RepID=A0A2A6CPI2_PRIPA|nr:hypothetical protein PRIPAC_79617 [Pristionchus pacificus]|eukprot:PDM79977.1 G protein-coupled receptor [Pristionchus pacificus]
MLPIIPLFSSLAIASATEGGIDIPIPVDGADADSVPLTLHFNFPAMKNLSEQAKKEFADILFKQDITKTEMENQIRSWGAKNGIPDTVNAEIAKDDQRTKDLRYTAIEDNKSLTINQANEQTEALLDTINTPYLKRLIYATDEIRGIHKRYCFLRNAHSHNSVGVYKYCLYQIIAWPFVSQAVLIFGPVLVLPIIGVYHYIDFTDNPAVVHGILSAWALICCFDIQSILDGFTFRLRVILQAFHPNLANKYFWISVVVILKVTGILLCVFFIAPTGKYLNRIDMRANMMERYPHVVDTFDSYKSFVVYDIETLPGFKQCIVIMSIFMGVLCIYGGGIVLAIFVILHLHRANMSESTRRLHARFVTQLSVQGSIPFVVMICPLIAILALTLMKFQRLRSIRGRKGGDSCLILSQTRSYTISAPGYAITVFLITHSPLTSLMTIFIYDSYRKRSKLWVFFHMDLPAVTEMSASEELFDMPVSHFFLLKYDLVLMIMMRTIEGLTVIVFIFTICIVYANSTHSVGLYKYCLYQIVAWPFISHAFIIFGPVIVLPILGFYHYIDFTDNLAVIHGGLCAWLLICSYDIQSIMDGFTFRLRVLLQAFYPSLACKTIWISIALVPKVTSTIFCVCFFVLIGQRLKRDGMRIYLMKNYPNVVPIFDSYKSFVVYDMKQLSGFKDFMLISGVVMCTVCSFGMAIVFTTFKILHDHRCRMSFSTRRLHARLITQLSVQALIPFVVLICPLFALLTLTLFEFQFQTNFSGYVISIFLMTHSPLTSIMTLALYDQYRKATVQFFQTMILRRTTVRHRRNNASVSNVNKNYLLPVQSKFITDSFGSCKSSTLSYFSSPFESFKYFFTIKKNDYNNALNHQVHSTRSVGMYKYCLYQIVLWPSISQLCTILGPIFVLPVIGAYHYIDFTDNPAVVHGILCAWIVVCSFDIASILDGFNFRLRILLLSSHPRLAFKPYWIFTYFSSKVVAAIFVVCWIAPIGQYLDRDEMREYLANRYPKVLTKFDAYKTFVVYNVKELPGFWEAMVILSIVVVLVFCYGISVVFAIFKLLLHNQRTKMSIGTQRMHARFLSQLSTQACVPFIILLCPLFALVILTLFEFQFLSNAPGYAITIFLIMHAPITSLLTLYLYTPYRKAILEFWYERILCRRVAHANNYSLLNANIVTVSSKRKM